METIYFEDARKQRFLEALRKGAPTERRAALQTHIKFSEVRKWLDNPDFALAVTEAKEINNEVEQQKLDSIENKVFEAAEDGDSRLMMDVLRARRPERWNPAMKVDFGELKHRFIDFSGNPLHERVDPIDVDFERVENATPAED